MMFKVDLIFKRRHTYANIMQEVTPFNWVFLTVGLSFALLEVNFHPASRFVIGGVTSREVHVLDIVEALERFEIVMGMILR